MAEILNNKTQVNKKSKCIQQTALSDRLAAAVMAEDGEL